MAQADKQSFEIVFAGLFDLAALDPDKIDRQLVAFDQSVEVKTETGDVLDQLGFALLEGHDHAGLAELRRRRGR